MKKKDNRVSGKAGIRTLGTRRYNGFRDRPDRPLRHLSEKTLAKVRKKREKQNPRALILKIMIPLRSQQINRSHKYPIFSFVSPTYSSQDQ